MDFAFAPADHILGKEGTVVATNLKDHPKLPDGTYKFAELYCTDPHCDCRKTIIQVVHNGQPVGSIDFGWETLKFYTKWARGDKELAREMQGWSSNPLAKNRLDPADLIELLQGLMDDKWLATIKSTYQQIRKELKRQHRPAPSPSSRKAPSRNSPCPCGSGKKYKRCCIDQPNNDAPQDLTPFPDRNPFLENLQARLPTELAAEFTSELERKVDQAIDQLDESNFEQARDILFPLLEENPSDAYLLYALGLYHALQDEVDESIPYLQESTKLDPGFAAAWFYLQLSYHRASYITGSIQCARMVLKHGDPDESFVKATRELLNQTGKIIKEKFNLDLDKYLTRHSKFDTATFNLNQSKLPEAVEGFKQVLSESPNDEQTHHNLALCHALLGDRTKALDHLYRCLKSNPFHKESLALKPHIVAMTDGEKIDLPAQSSSTL